MKYKVIIPLLSIIVMLATPLFAQPENPEQRGRHKAVMAALVYCEEYSVRIAWGARHDGGGYHAQAQAYIKGEWYWLQVVAYGSEIQVEIGEQDDWFTVSRTFTLKEFLDWDWFNRGYGIQEVI